MKMTRTMRDVSLALAAALPVVAFLLEYGGIGSEIHPGVVPPFFQPYVAALPKLLFLWLAFWYSRRSSLGFDTDNPIRPAWSLLAWGILGFAVAHSILAFHTLVLGGPTPFPSLADVFFLLGYVLFLPALVLFVTAYRRAGFPLGNPGQHLTLLLVLLAILTIGGYRVLEPILETPAPAIERFLNVAYPTLDLLLLLPTAALLRITIGFRGGQVWRVWVAVLCGFVLMSVGDILFAYEMILSRYDFAPLAHAMFILAYALVARGTAQQHDLLTA